MMKIRYKETGTESMIFRADAKAPYLYWKKLDELGLVKHGFSTRLGGVSEGYYSSMNLGMRTGDSIEHVRENFRILAESMDIPFESLVSSQQTHTTHVIRVGMDHCGSGITRPDDYTDVDGMITNEPGVALACFGADCVPIYFVDPVRRAIGMCHSGWRGTVGKIAEVTLTSMKEAFGTESKDCFCAIGPSICQDCYEVSEDVIERFRDNFPAESWNEIFSTGKAKGKYQLNLWEANRVILEACGVPRDHILISGICTNCNPELLFSHRYTGGKRGNNGGFLMLNHPDSKE